MGKMKALTYYAPRDLRVDSIDIPECGDNDVLIKVKACGICGSDLHTYRDGALCQPGQVMGHEYSGEVVKVGSKVTNVEVGQRGTGLYAEVCGTCFWCKHGEYSFCTELFKNLTAYGRQGAFAEYICIPAKAFMPMPDNMGFIEGASAEPVSCAMHVVEVSKMQPGDKVVVLGGGAIGNYTMQAFKAAGAGCVILVEPNTYRRNMATQMGADLVIDPTQEDVVKRIQEEFGVGYYHGCKPGAEGAMADIVADCAGSPSIFAQAFEIVRTCGTLALFAILDKPTEIIPRRIIQKNLRIVSCIGGDRSRALTTVYEGKIKVKPLISHTFPLSDALEAFDTAVAGGKAMKVMIGDF